MTQTIQAYLKPVDSATYIQCVDPDGRLVTQLRGKRHHNSSWVEVYGLCWDSDSCSYFYVKRDDDPPAIILGQARYLSLRAQPDQNNYSLTLPTNCRQLKRLILDQVILTFNRITLAASETRTNTLTVELRRGSYLTRASNTTSLDLVIGSRDLDSIRASLFGLMNQGLTDLTVRLRTAADVALLQPEYPSFDLRCTLKH